ncbi:DNA cytosine methyltransferase, partial [Micromonospora fluostatini]
VEINPFCRSVLARHWPEVPRHDDVRTAVAWWLSEPRPPVHVVAGGYPCQPDSLAGKRRGTDDDRWLWPEMARVIHAVQPWFVIGENVLGHRTRGLRFVLRDLERLGYTARAGIVRACEMGASHPRPRLFVLAHTNRPGRPAWSGVGPARPTAVGEGRWPAEPGVGRVAHGLPGRVDRVTA